MNSTLQIHGHRGARGLYPENTLIAFKEAIKLGVDAIELDVVISKDEQVVVSHEEWMNEDFCLAPNNKEIEGNSKNEYNLFAMNYTEIVQYDCGSKQNKKFPKQKTIKAYKPLLNEVIETIENYIKTQGLKPVIYNIEIKSDVLNEPQFQPTPKKMVDLVLRTLSTFNLPRQRLLIQSFDMRVLQELKKTDINIPLGLLIEYSDDYKNHIKQLGFIPDFYNPEYVLVSQEMVDYMHQLNIQVIPWTVNELYDMKALTKLDVDGLITDYPNIALNFLKQK